MGAEFTKTAHLSSREWLITVALGAIALPLGVFMRFIPVKVNTMKIRHISPPPPPSREDGCRHLSSSSLDAGFCAVVEVGTGVWWGQCVFNCSPPLEQLFSLFFTFFFFAVTFIGRICRRLYEVDNYSTWRWLPHTAL